MKHLTKRSAIAVVISLSLFAASCSPSKIREARKAAHRIQVTIDASTDSLISLHNKHIVSDAKTRQLALGLQKANNANSVLIAHAKEATADTPATRQQLLTDVQGVIDAVRELKDAGILGIKSENGTLAFDAAINAMETSVQIIKGALQ